MSNAAKYFFSLKEMLLERERNVIVEAKGK